MSGRSAMRRSYGQALRRRSVVSRLGDRVLCRTLRSRSPRDCIDAPRPGDRILRRCAVAFDTGDAPAAGSLVVTDAAVWLSGRCHGEPVELGIPRDELTRVRIGRSSGERLNGYSTGRSGAADWCRRTGGAVRLRTSARDRRATRFDQRSADPSVRATRTDRADPERQPPSGQAIGFKRATFRTGQAWVETPRRLPRPRPRAIRLRGRWCAGALQYLLGDAALWCAGLSWRRHLAGRPYLRDETPDDAVSGELVYSWRC
jgi:hypothetical protein